MTQPADPFLSVFFFFFFFNRGVGGGCGCVGGRWDCGRGLGGVWEGVGAEQDRCQAFDTVSCQVSCRRCYPPLRDEETEAERG